jgi:uncharacterized protein YicC (UPF0701 family)
VPKREEKPVMGLTTDKNFVVSNAVETILAAPKQTVVDRAIDKRTFGQVPTYLTNIKADLKQQYEFGEEVAAAQVRANQDMTQLSEDEVQQLRSGLQVRLDSLNAQFQTLSFSLETTSQKKHKETLEQNMAGIEAALKKLGKKRVFVMNA